MLIILYNNYTRGISLASNDKMAVFYLFTFVSSRTNDQLVVI